MTVLPWDGRLTRGPEHDSVNRPIRLFLNVGRFQCKNHLSSRPKAWIQLPGPDGYEQSLRIIAVSDRV